ncbi:transcription antitermination factor NusB [Fructilactobacillus fructivorans]|uniref:Transcription antitermination protein NusB n=1 Tax=Fructilactobacillus fructivorans TaxID=1614 RepID=A0AAE6TWF1_9LACO|nr:transcription antitermination factor NusB [Fructilactobacillus fructivorans]QFX92592.1 transcription antitermination factor NusB [Fructilactobacillus fructivorans]RDV65814.1 transcription antitermination factor NusB [Fructilactobacillus fructivorans]
MKISRHQIRELAFQTLFAMESNDSVEPSEFFDYLVKEDVTAPKYYLELVNGVRDHKTELDAIITDHLANKWSIDRISKADLIILRIALFEIKYVEATPNKVAINEALELAKKFCDDKSRNFINGVLDSVIEK